MKGWFGHETRHKQAQIAKQDQPEESDTLTIARVGEVKVDGLGVSDVQNTVGLGWETSADLSKQSMHVVADSNKSASQTYSDPTTDINRSRFSDTPGRRSLRDAS